MVEQSVIDFRYCDRCFNISLGYTLTVKFQRIVTGPTIKTSSKLQSGFCIRPSVVFIYTTVSVVKFTSSNGFARNRDRLGWSFLIVVEHFLLTPGLNH